MPAKRFNLPPLDLIQGFEAAARTSASPRRPRSCSSPSRPSAGRSARWRSTWACRCSSAGTARLVLTEQGRMLQRRPPSCWSGCRTSPTGCAPHGATRHLTVTTTSGFASLWLIPRLRGFTTLQPDVDVRISATYKTINLERSLVDVAVRYCLERGGAARAPRGCFGEELFPVCSPALLGGWRRSRCAPCRTLSTTRCCTWTGPPATLDWGTWLAAQGCADLKPAASLRFDSYEQMIGAALSGQGVAMGIGRLVSGLMQEGRLVAPFCKSVVGQRAYYVIRSPLTGARAARAGVRGLADRGSQDAWRFRRRGRAQLPTTSGEVSRRKAASDAQRGDAAGARVLRTGCSRSSWSGPRNPT